MSYEGEVFIIESNSSGSGLSAILQAKRLGYSTHFLTCQPEKYQSFDVNPMEAADQCTLIDTNDVIKLLHFMADKQPLAVLTFDDFHVFQAAIVAAQHGLVHTGLDGLVNVRFKEKTRMFTNVSGAGQPVLFEVREPDEIDQLPSFGLPCVVKPLDESGSTGVRVCYSKQDFQAAMQAISVMETVKKSGYKRAGKVLIEEYVEGDEYSAEMIWDAKAGLWQLIGYTKKYITLPYCIEVAHSFPYSFGNDMDDSVLAVIRSWLGSLKFLNSAAHVEFKITANGVPALMEVNPRPAGGMINELVRYAQGRDNSAALLDLHLGRALPDFPKLLKGKCATVHFLVPKEHGTVTEVIPPKEVSPGIVASKFTRKEQRVSAGNKKSDLDIGYVIAVADTQQESFELTKSYAEACRCMYEQTEEVE
ncbi:ATP-grasp domain-containing protein [Tumebacillus avium]|uniref:ATP-grasp domain-containing protein n=1 Tax=Tumebacillus avium TaxID=1903704 RepID=UPI0012FDA1CD|nr:ATP-grasp domain-containing protein [Tumebacillus avium]